MNQPDKNHANHLLGYPDSARLLIVNADDFGMYPAVNDAIFRAIKGGIVQSTSLMVPCPWALNAVQILRDNPEIPFGVHLSVICDLPNYRWGPLTPKARVPSLVEATGSFYHLDQRTDFLAQARIEELEIEFRAQIEAVFAARLNPTHLDWHCLADGGRADILDLTLGLAKEYGLAVRVHEPALAEKLWSEGLPSGDYPLLDSFSINIATKPARYAQMLRDLPAGLSEWAVHPGLANAESQALDGGWQVRSSDFEFLTSAEAREIIRQEEIILLSYEPLQQVWKRQHAR